MRRSVFWFVFMPLGIVAVLFCCGWMLMDSVSCSLSKESRIEPDFRAIGSALKTYHMNAGNYPTIAQGLEALGTKPTTPPIPKRWIQIFDTTPKDPWGTTYDYRLLEDDDPRGFELRSAGEDRKFGTKDDISSLHR